MRFDVSSSMETPDSLSCCDVSCCKDEPVAAKPELTCDPAKPMFPTRPAYAFVGLAPLGRLLDWTASSVLTFPLLPAEPSELAAICDPPVSATVIPAAALPAAG